MKFNFSHFIPQITLFFAEKSKENLKFSESKMQWKEESENHFRKTCELKQNFRENNQCNFEKAQVALGTAEQI